MQSRHKCAYFLAACVVAAGAVPARASVDDRHRVDISGGRLSAALAEFARETGAELLFNQQIVSGLRVGPLKGTLSTRDALLRLLAGTGISFRRTNGSFVLYVAPLSAPASQAEEPPVPDILVIGRRTQNVDIRRRENDIQPYQVATGERIVRAQRDNLDQYFRSHVTGNTQVLPPSLLDNGETVSEIDLRGLGSNGTLILLDGRRLPSIPTSDRPLSFRQADLNAIPLHAIARVETLTGTAGGIYGFGALGGVVNVILKRDYRGVDLHGTAGITSRGDARRLGLEGRIGFTPNEGRTDVMLYLGHTRSRPLLLGDRDYGLRDRVAINEFAPDVYDTLARIGTYSSNSVGIFTFPAGRDLAFKPEFGGGSLGGDRTFLPLGFAGSPAELASALRDRAGQLDFTSPEEEARSELGSHATTSSILLNIRHRLGAGLEAFADAVYLRNRGPHRSFISFGFAFVPGQAPGNPFNGPVLVTYPIRGGVRERETTFTTERYTAGLVASLPFDWRATGEATFGSVQQVFEASEQRFRPQFGATLNPFGPWDEFVRAATARRSSRTDLLRVQTRYQEQALRIAGPIWTTGAGTATLTLLAERRHEKVPRYTSSIDFDDEPADLEFDSRASRTTAFYGELRAPLTSPEMPVPFLRDLEVQLALRRQALSASFSSDPEASLTGGRQDARYAATSYTAGAKVSPWSWLMLRGSYATGRQPPPLEDLISTERTTCVEFFDPERRGADECPEAVLLVKAGGSSDLEMVRASTLSAGAILMPLGEVGPRLSLDYSTVRRTGDPYLLDEARVLAEEDRWPERVTRAPLTDEDRARGFTAGRLTLLDARAANGGSLTVKTLDARAEWPIEILGGRLRAYAAGTLQLGNLQKGLFEPAVERIGYRTGPLKLRANGGLDWTGRSTSIGANLQYYGRYRSTVPSDFDSVTGLVERVQGSVWVPAQAYLDLYAGRRFRTESAGSRREISVDVGIANVFDKAPARETGAVSRGPGYSRYGDPRRRRFELRVSTSF